MPKSTFSFYKQTGLWLITLLLYPVSGFSQVAKDSTGTSLQSPKGDVKESVLKTATDLLEDKDFPGSWPLFGTDLRMKIGGYLKTDFLYDFDGVTDNTQFLMSTIPVEGEEAFGSEGYVSFFAKETRVNVDVRRVAEDKIPLQLFVEADFFNEQNRFRLRHAYITAGDFIIGQTWTTLSFLESMAFMIDFAAGDALFGGRTTQIRYQKKLNKGFQLSVGVEYLGFLGIENSFGFDGKANVQLPLLALRLDKRWETGVLFMGASLAQLRWDGGDTGPSDQLRQLAFIVAGRQYLGKNNYFTWNVNTGSAYGENILAFAGSQANALLNENGELEPIGAYSLMGGFMHRWAPGLESNFNYAYGWLDAPETRADFALKRGGVGHLNLIYHFDENFSIGAEYMWGAQRTANDAFGRASRFQTMAKFQF